ncbi:MAG: rane carboxypeptidase (penicillin-binding protein) [Actinomycetia bacterium]|nr:rane carboxypeptidase (penicillin-binding protein) [Actinomycetes bacterium]
MAPVRSLLKFLVIIVVGGTLVGVCLAAIIPGARAIVTGATVSNKLEVSFKKLDQISIVYDKDGNEIGQLGLQNRDPVPLKAVPKLLQQAVIDTEDRTFYDNPGVDLQSIVRAFTKNVGAGQVSQGGSTITQQLVKNRILTSKRDLNRKVKEAILAYRVNEQYSKSYILGQYLNTVYFGQGSYGVKTAAARFFQTKNLDGSPRGKNLNELTLPEDALLAGLISNPEGANPFAYPARAKARRSAVLDGMVKEHTITQAQADAARDAPLPTVKPPAELRPTNYFVDEVQRRLLSEPSLGATVADRQKAVLTGGLRIYTTYDPQAQKLAQDAVNSTLPNQPPFTAALVSMDPANGEVRAMVAGVDFATAKYNLATQGDGRQPGSTYKVITLTAAIENGFSPNDTVDGTSPCSVRFPNNRTPYDTQNAEPGGGIMTLRTALAESVNCAFVRVAAALTPEKIAFQAKNLGITHDVPAYPSITLGTDGTTPLEMATVFNTIASGGIRHYPVFIRRVTDASGKEIFKANTTGTRVISAQTAATVTDMMRGVITGGTGTAARLNGGRIAAGKTGTTDKKTDAWFCGFVPQLSTCVWMGAPQGGIPMTRVGGISVFGGTYPAKVWKKYVDAELTNQPIQQFAPPDARLWPAGKFITEKGRGVEVAPPPPTAPTTTAVDPNATTTTAVSPTTTTAPAATTTAPPATTTAHP